MSVCVCDGKEGRERERKGERERERERERIEEFSVLSIKPGIIFPSLKIRI